MSKESISKLKQTHADDILTAFDDGDIKGMYGVNLAIVEWIIRNGNDE